MPIFPLVTRSRKRFLEYVLKKNPNLDEESINIITAHIMVHEYEGHYLEGMIFIHSMSPYLLLHEFSHHILWKLKYPLFLHMLLDIFDIVLRRK